MGQSAQKVPARQMWQKFDRDKSGVMDRKEVENLLKDIWKTYKAGRVRRVYKWEAPVL
ncbi:unnamed protein product [Effrenium voratum]|nr:unnamed protein product [Effrenium voratum]